MFAGILDLALVCLLVPVFAKYAGLKDEAAHGFSLISGAGVIFLLAQSFRLSEAFTTTVSSMAELAGMIFGLIGWLFLLIGSLLVAWRLAMSE